jgi:hypothetical protein
MTTLFHPAESGESAGLARKSAILKDARSNGVRDDSCSGVGFTGRF